MTSWPSYNCIGWTLYTYSLSFVFYGLRRPGRLPSTRPQNMSSTRRHTACRILFASPPHCIVSLPAVTHSITNTAIYTTDLRTGFFTFMGGRGSRGNSVSDREIHSVSPSEKSGSLVSPSPYYFSKRSCRITN